MFQSARAASILPIISTSVLVALKLSVGISIGSISVVSDGLDTAIDMVSAFVAFISIRIASRPADLSHPYGHGKAEYLSGIVEAFFILAGVAFITFEAVRRILNDSDLRFVELGIAVMGLSVIVNLVVSWQVIRVARRTGSPALSAAGKHRAADVLTSLGILIGLVIVRITGFTLLDPILALGVAAVVLWAALQILRSSFNSLMDASLPQEEQQRVSELVDSYRDLSRLEKMSTRQAGTQRYFDIVLITCQHLTVGKAHQLTGRIEGDILRAFPGSRVSIRLEPCVQETGPVNGTAATS